MINKNLFNTICFIVFTLLFGLYVESYEVIISSFISSTYTSIALTDFDFDVSTIFIPLLSVVDLALDIQLRVYDYFILTLTFLAFIFLGKIINKNFNSGWIFTITFTIILLPSVLNTGITRITFYFFFICCYYYLFDKKLLNWAEKITFPLAILMLCFFRVDAVLLSSLILLVFIFITKKKFRLIFLMPLLISLMFYASYNVWMNNNPNEAKKAFYYEEFDVFDRELVNSYAFPENTRYSIELANKYSIYDQEMFNYGLFTKKSSGTNYFYLIDGVLSFESFKNTFNNSLDDIKKSSFIILISLLLFLVSIYIDKKNFIDILLFLLPLSIVSLVIIPARFVVPYYTIFSFYLLHKLFLSKKINLKILLFIVNIIVISYLAIDVNEKLYLNSMSKQYKNELKRIEGKYEGYNIILERFNPEFHVFKFFDKKIETNATLLHYFYFTGFDSYENEWLNLCQNCNVLSIKDKLTFLSKSKSIFISSPFYLDALKKYMIEKHKIRLEETALDDFFQDLKIYKIEMVSN
jgi:hypothetical protein